MALNVASSHVNPVGLCRGKCRFRTRQVSSQVNFQDWIAFDGFNAETTTRKFSHLQTITSPPFYRSRSSAFGFLKWCAHLSICNSVNSGHSGTNEGNYRLFSRVRSGVFAIFCDTQPFFQEWFDPVLQWNTSFSNKTYLKLKESRIWTPQLSIPMRFVDLFKEHRWL